MAKKAKSAMTVADLSTEEIDRLGGILHGGSGNVYRVVESTFGIEDPGEEIFDRLEKEAGVFKCVMCDEWKTLSERDRGSDDTCTECLNGDE